MKLLIEVEVENNAKERLNKLSVYSHLESYICCFDTVSTAKGASFRVNRTVLRG